LLRDLRATEQQRFAVPGAPAEAPLSHLVIHAQDVYRPLGWRPRRTRTPPGSPSAS
jgi:hypothetical protein